ncbi:MAG: hypothetical protein V7K59_09140 [Nostoc sp.]
MPVSIHETHEFLKKIIPKTNVALDEGAKGRAEGIVAMFCRQIEITGCLYKDLTAFDKPLHRLRLDLLLVKYLY